MILKNMDEDQRSVLWRVVVIAATCIILFVILFFGIRLFTDNPLDGFWQSEDAAIMLEFDGDDNEADAMWEDASGNFHQVTLKYTLDKKEKTVSIRPEEIQDSLTGGSAGDLAEQGLAENFGLITATFDYSLEGDTLTLTERESGEQLVFTRK